MQDDVVIVCGARTPMGGLLGQLSSLSAVELGSHAIQASLAAANIAAADVQEVYLGCVLPAGLKQGPARQAALKAGIPDSAGAVTINKLCGSAMQATIFAHDAIKVGSCSVAVAGGMESMSNAPHLLPHARGGVGSGQKALNDHLFTDGLQDAETGHLMGHFAQLTANTHHISREAMDNFAIASLKRARAAMTNGDIDAEISPIDITYRGKTTRISDDEQPPKAKLEKIPQLRPAFDPAGTITAANASSISDGASALVLMSAAQAEARQCQALATIKAHARYSQHPSEFTTAPIGAIKNLLAKTGWTTGDVDLWEINEAFAVVTMLAIQALSLDPAKVNIYGGACAQGHPIGSTGSRIILTLAHALKRSGKKRGIAALCIGGGEALAIAIENTD